VCSAARVAVAAAFLAARVAAAAAFPAACVAAAAVASAASALVAAFPAAPVAAAGFAAESAHCCAAEGSVAAAALLGVCYHHSLLYDLQRQCRPCVCVCVWPLSDQEGTRYPPLRCSPFFSFSSHHPDCRLPSSRQSAHHNQCRRCPCWHWWWWCCCTFCWGGLLGYEGSSHW